MALKINRLYKMMQSDPAAIKELDRLFAESTHINAECDSESLCCDEDAYIALSEVISKNRTIYDFGAAYGIQSWLFRNHKKYVGIDLEIFHKEDPKGYFVTANSEWHFCGIRKFLEEHEIPQESFAICNYVPEWDKEALKMLRLKCPHLYINYPCGEWKEK